MHAFLSSPFPFCSSSFNWYNTLYRSLYRIPIPYREDLPIQDADFEKGVSGCKALRYIRLAGNSNITTLKCLSNMKTLQRVIASNCSQLKVFSFSLPFSSFLLFLCFSKESIVIYSFKHLFQSYLRKWYWRDLPYHWLISPTQDSFSIFQLRYSSKKISQ